MNQLKYIYNKYENNGRFQNNYMILKLKNILKNYIKEL